MKDDLGNRMKRYEQASKIKLVHRVPAVLRVDGKAFHTFCKRFIKPYDEIFNNALTDAMLFLCKKIQGAEFGERHSDEISILLWDAQTIKTCAFFDYEVQKIVSVVAGWAAGAFCKSLLRSSVNAATEYLTLEEDWPTVDCRVFNIPKDEVGNYFWWRITDAVRNSIQGLAQQFFSHKELNKKNQQNMHEMLYQKNINWANLPPEQKTGMVCYKKSMPYIIPRGPKAGQLINKMEWMLRVSPKTRQDLNNINIIESFEGRIYE